MFDRINAWINSETPSYQEGLNLIEDVEISSAKRFLLSLGPSEHNYDFIRKLLNDKLLSVNHVQELVIENPLKILLKEKFKVANFLFQKKLGDHIPQNDRAIAARRIISIFDNDIRPIQNDLKNSTNFYLKKIEPKEETIIDLLRALMNVRTYISKYKNIPDKADLLEEYRQKQVIIENRINAIQNK